MVYPTTLDDATTVVPHREPLGAENAARLVEADYRAAALVAVEARVGTGASTPATAGAGATLVAGASGASTWRTPLISAVTAITTGGTVAVTTDVALLNPAGNVTGVIVAAGAYDGQALTLINQSAFSVTMAAAGTSNVANGTGAVVATLTSRRLTYDLVGALWYIN